MMSALLLLVTCFGAIGEIFIGGWLFVALEAVGLFAFLILEFPRLARIAKVLALVCLAFVFYWVLAGQTDLALFKTALTRASFIVFFLTSLGFLQHTATRSALIKQAGEVLVHQPPGRRYFVLTFGSALLGMLLSLATLGLLGSMIGKEPAPARDSERSRVAETRRRRMILAILRGYSLVPMWSPISMVIVILGASNPDLNYVEFALRSGPLAVVLMLLGWGLDHISYKRRTTADAAPFPSLSKLGPVLLLVACVPFSAFVVASLIDRPMLQALLLCLPVISLGWTYVQKRKSADALSQTYKELSTGIIPSLPRLRSEIALVACSTILAVLITPLIDTEALAHAIIGLGSSSGLVLAALAWLVLITAVAGITPIFTVSVLATMLPTLDALQIEPVWINVMLVSVWSLVPSVSPISLPGRLAALAVGQAPLRVTLLWNGHFALISITLLSLVLVAFG